MTCLTDSRVRFAASLAAALLMGQMWQGPVSAAIIGIKSDVQTTVQERIDGADGSISSDSDGLDAGAEDFPITAVAQLVTTDIDNNLTAFGLGSSEMIDPAAAAQQNPEEFSLEVGGFSNQARIGYDLSSTAREQRTLRFSSDRNEEAITFAFNADGTRELISTAYVGGAMIFWSTENAGDLNGDSGLRGRLQLTVTRDDSNDTLLALAADFDPAAGGDETVKTTGTFDMQSGGVELLRGIADEDAIKALEAIEEIGSVFIVLVPAQQLDYRYTVRDGETFTMTASFDTSASLSAAGSGAAAAWGRDFRELGDLLNNALPEINGQAVEKAINKAVWESGATTDELPQSVPMRPAFPCGMLGMTPLLLMTAALGMLRFRRL